MQLFGSSGIRRIVDREFLNLAFQVGLSVGKSYHSVVVGSDTRTSSDATQYAIISGLLSTGCKTYNAGLMPTPTLAYAARKFEAGVMVTASHNPPNYNGIKLFNSDGSAFDSLQRRKIEEEIYNNSLEVTPWDRMQHLGSYEDGIEEHIDRILQDFSQVSKVRVVVDCGCGAASTITPHMLRKLGCEAVSINCYPSGFFPRAGEPAKQNLTQLIKVVKAADATLGIAHDGDGDRMMAVDERGRFIPGDKLLVLFAREMGAKKVITTVDASMTIEEQGFEVIRTRVGDAFVSEELKKGGEFGGEPSGSWIFPQVSYCPDGIYAAALLIQMASQGKLSHQVDALPSYPILRGEIPIEKIGMESIEKKLMALEPVSVSAADGIRLIFEDGWLLVRASGTEPKIRITAEAKDAKSVETLYNRALELIQDNRSE